MTYLLSFEDEEQIRDIYVRVNRPMGFDTFIDMYVIDKVVLSADVGNNFMIRDLISIQKIGRDWPYDYDLTMDGKLLKYSEVTT